MDDSTVNEREPVRREAPATGGKAKWTRLAMLGLAMVALGPLLMLVASLLWGLDVGEDIAFFLAPVVLAGIGFFLVAKFGTWAKIVGAVLAFLAGGMVFWTAFGLATPQAFFDFVPGLLVIPGAIIAIASCIGAIVAGRRGRFSEEPVGGERSALRIIPAVLGVLILLSGVLTFVGKSSVDANEADQTVEMADFEFDQDEYDFQAGTTVLVRNSDPFLHTFTIEDLDIDESLGPNDEVLVEIPDSTGEYTVFCRPHTSNPTSPSEDDMAAGATIQ